MPELPAAWAAPGAAAPQVTTPVRAAPAQPEARVRTGLRPIPLRPLSALELIDGAIGAVRAVPAALLGWASILVVALALADFAFAWVFNAAVAAAARVHPLITTDMFGNTIVQYGRTSDAGTFGLVVVNAFMPIVSSGIAVTVVAGLIAEPVKRYVDGNGAPEPISQDREAGANRALIARLSLIAIVSSLPRVILLVLYALTTLAIANDPQSSVGAVLTPLTLVGVPICAWLTADWAVAAPVAALEGGRGFAALGRARRLASRGRWRTLWITVLTLVIALCVVGPLTICQYYIGSVHGVSGLLNGETVSGATYWWLVGYVVLAALAQALTAPFRAATATMLYVDRRFRREGLDIRIAWARVARTIGNGNGNRTGNGNGSGR